MNKVISKQTTQSPETGLSVIEVLISIVVLAVGLVSIVGISAIVSRMNSTSNNINILAAVGRMKWTGCVQQPGRKAPKIP